MKSFTLVFASLFTLALHAGCLDQYGVDEKSSLNEIHRAISRRFTLLEPKSFEKHFVFRGTDDQVIVYKMADGTFSLAYSFADENKKPAGLPLEITHLEDLTGKWGKKLREVSSDEIFEVGPLRYKVSFSGKAVIKAKLDRQFSCTEYREEATDPKCSCF